MNKWHHCHWILDENGVPRATDLLTWAKWFEEDFNKRIVKQEYVGELWVSTVFLGIDHNFTETGPPILWETMVFKTVKPRTVTIKGKKLKTPGMECIEQNRCSGSWEQAEAMHHDMVERVQAVEAINA